MRFILCILLAILFLGCLGIGAPANETTTQNITPGNITNQTPVSWQRHSAGVFSFEYPADMAAETSPGLFTGTSQFDGTTREILVVMHMNTSAAYGENQEEIFRDEPTLAAAGFLEDDLFMDLAGVLDRAYDAGEVSTFSISRDAYVAELSFRFRPQGFVSSYEGHALDIYVPERSTLIRVRAMAIDPAASEDIKERFLLSFRLD